MEKWAAQELQYADLTVRFASFEIQVSSHAKLITCPIELKPLRGNDRHV